VSGHNKIRQPKIYASGSMLRQRNAISLVVGYKGEAGYIATNYAVVPGPLQSCIRAKLASLPALQPRCQFVLIVDLLTIVSC